MKIKHITLILLALSSLFAKDVIIEDSQLLYGNPENPGFFPSYTQDAKTVLFTRNAYQGLWAYDRSTFAVEQITDVQGAGYHPRSLSDGSIIFRHDEYRKGRKYTALYKADASGSHLVAPAGRFISTANLINDKLVYLSDEMPVVFNAVNEQRESSHLGVTAILNDKLSLQVLQDGVLRPLSPRGEGNYIWGELSPAADKVVFTRTGDGTYICNLQGNIISDLGYAHAPQWSPDGEFLVYMKDLDDGYQYTASEIWIISADGSQSWMVTDTADQIEMYPHWSPDGEHIVYHTLRGKIFETSIQIVD